MSEGGNTPVAAARRSWWQRPWFTVVMLILFAPVGISLMWRYQGWSRQAKWVVTGCAVLWFLASTFGSDRTPKSEPQNAPKAASTAAAERPASTVTAAPTATRIPPGFTVEYVTSVIRESSSSPLRSNLDNLQVDLDPGSGLVNVAVKPNSLLNETDALTIGSGTIFRAARAVFANLPEARVLRVSMLADLTDNLGNTRTSSVTMSEISRATASTFNYDGLRDRVLADNKLMYCNSDHYSIHPTVFTKLKDRGCLLLPTK